MARSGGAPDDAFRSWSYEWAEPVDRETLLAMLRDAKDVLRAKGIVRFADAPDTRSIVHMVGRRIDVSEDGPWTDGDSRLVLLGPKPVLGSSLPSPVFWGGVAVIRDGGVMSHGQTATHDPSVAV